MQTNLELQNTDQWMPCNGRGDGEGEQDYKGT